MLRPRPGVTSAPPFGRPLPATSVVAPTSTATSRSAASAVSANDKAGVFGTEIERLEPGDPQEVGQDGPGQTVLLSGGAPKTTVPRVRPRRAKRGPSRPMMRAATALAPVLVGHGQLAALPAVSDRSQGGDQDVEVDVCGVRARGQRALDHLPCAGLVTGDQAVDQPSRPLGSRRPVARRAPPAPR